MTRITEWLERFWPYLLVAAALIGLAYRAWIGGF